MDAKQVLNADFLDIIFDGKNKEYGAYELRKTYNKRIITGVIFMLAFTALFLLLSVLGNSTKKAKTQIMVQDVSLANVTEEVSISAITG